ncbi:glycosyltransferase [Amnibacterium kyonggiense]|uniref:Glycosyltransferase involved in cell wall biosynthesis n=1 Tax=Amnibacterium kyonggiense TaxID=595671 RepID=A0A4R7FSR1_9MICO|nr:glycosyltransferase [Amnibacterium kyonggiense]TDS80907.1 glycosyltransferase involved in cell wall biosynthesis [Amnibacterium kyonggiense]
MRVSVVVAVFDPGPHLSALLDSLRAQTLDPAEFEAVLVDDGSTDGTAAVLDAAAEEDSRFRVIHTPNSGWPGRPRNIGIDAARGDFVFIADHDDHLHPEALQRLTDFAIEHGSDVVAGRVVGVGRNAPTRIFERTLIDAQEDPALLMTSLTPQKLYRRAFLVEERIRFPEGPRRLEDHLFVTKAYLRARRVSVYADAPIYYFVLRDDGRNASRRPVEWRGYFANAAEAIAVVDAEAPDEATRVAMRARWLRVEAIGRLRGARFLGQADRAGLLAATGWLLREHYPGAEVDRLGPVDRLIGRLLLDGRAEDVVAVATWETSVRLAAAVEAVEAAGGALRVRIRLEQVADPFPLTDLPDGGPDRGELERTLRLPEDATAEAELRRSGGAPVALRVEQRIVGGVLEAAAVLDPARAAEVAEGRWLLRARVPEAAVRAPGTLGAPAELPGPTRVGPRRITPSVDRSGRLVLAVERAGLGPALRRVARRVRSGLRRHRRR